MGWVFRSGDRGLGSGSEGPGGLGHIKTTKLYEAQDRDLYGTDSVNVFEWKAY